MLRLIFWVLDRLVRAAAVLAIAVLAVAGIAVLSRQVHLELDLPIEIRLQNQADGTIGVTVTVPFAPEQIPAPVVLQIGEVRDASPEDWAAMMDMARAVSIEGRSPVTVSLQTWDFCSECDAQVPPAPAAAEPITVTVVHTGTVNHCHEVTGGATITHTGEVATGSTAPDPEDPCLDFRLWAPAEVTSGEQFVVTAAVPAGYPGGRVAFTAFNAVIEGDCGVRLDGWPDRVSTEILAPDMGEVWISIHATLYDKEGVGVCQVDTLIHDPPLNLEK